MKLFSARPIAPVQKEEEEKQEEDAVRMGSMGRADIRARTGEGH